MDRINSVVSDNKQLRDEMDQSFTLDDVTDILRRIGGLSRATLFDKAFYDKHPGAIMYSRIRDILTLSSISFTH